MTDAEKLWRHVEKTPTCWLWQASVNRGGYGNLTIKTDKGWHGVLAHRLAYRLAFGDIPAGLFVCHKCDTPRCVRNDGQNSHLFLGTSAENTMDCVNKGRIASGEMLPSAAFSDAMALKLLHEFAATGGTIAALARRHDVHPATMRHLIRRETYRHLDF